MTLINNLKKSSPRDFHFRPSSHCLIAEKNSYQIIININSRRKDISLVAFFNSACIILENQKEMENGKIILGKEEYN